MEQSEREPFFNRIRLKESLERCLFLVICQAISVLRNPLEPCTNVAGSLHIQPFRWNTKRNRLQAGSSRHRRCFLLVIIFDLIFRGWRTIFGICQYQRGDTKIVDNIIQILLAGTFLGSIFMSFNTHLKTGEFLRNINQLLELESTLDPKRLRYYGYIGSWYFMNTCSTVFALPVVVALFPSSILNSIYPTLVSPGDRIDFIMAGLLVSETIATSCLMFNWVFYIIVMLKFSRIQILGLTDLLEMRNVTKWRIQIRQYSSMQILNVHVEQSIRSIHLPLTFALMIVGTTATYTTLRLYNYFDFFTYSIYASSALMTLLLQLVPFLIMSKYSILSCQFLRCQQLSIAIQKRDAVFSRWEKNLRIREWKALRPIIFRMSDFLAFHSGSVLPALNTIMSVIIHTLITWKGGSEFR